jgi:hypothetical protein
MDPGNIPASLAMAEFVVLYEATIAIKMVLDPCMRENDTFDTFLSNQFIIYTLVS